jgi:hypothetical protein
MTPGLLPLLPKSIDFRGRKFRLLKDRHLFDSESVLTTDTSHAFFVTISTKKKSQAIFTGDFSLVKEANLFLVVSLQALIRDRILPSAEWNPFYKKGRFLWNVIVPETVAVDEDRILSIAPGPDLDHYTGGTLAVDNTWAYDRTYYGRRTFLQGANKVVPGGRAIEMTLFWEETGGNGLTATTDVSVIFGGGEYEPGSK